MTVRARRVGVGVETLALVALRGGQGPLAQGAPPANHVHARPGGDRGSPCERPCVCRFDAARTPATNGTQERFALWYSSGIKFQTNVGVLPAYMFYCEHAGGCVSDAGAGAFPDARRKSWAAVAA
jgi:hypothetical protein